MRGDARQVMVGLVQDEAEFCVEALKLQIEGPARWGKRQSETTFIFACFCLASMI